MASLQDQLLKAGLADSNKAKKVKSDKRKQAKVARNNKQEPVNRSKSSAKQLQSKRAERDRALNSQKQAEANQKAIAAQIVQLIQMNKIDRDNGEITYSFVHDKKVKNISVTKTIQKQLSLGYLSIVSYAGKNEKNYEVVPAVIAKKIAQRNAQSVVQIDVQDNSEIQEDDPYAEYQIPDDLMW